MCMHCDHVFQGKPDFNRYQDHANRKHPNQTEDDNICIAMNQGESLTQKMLVQKGINYDTKRPEPTALIILYFFIS